MIIIRQLHYTVCPRSSDPFYIVIYYTKGVTMYFLDIQYILARNQQVSEIYCILVVLKMVYLHGVLSLCVNNKMRYFSRNCHSVFAQCPAHCDSNPGRRCKHLPLCNITYGIRMGFFYGHTTGHTQNVKSTPISYFFYFTVNQNIFL